MYKILLADNEGVILDSLIHMIYDRFSESCDIRIAKTARYTRILARKFIPDIAVINIQMPGMRGFDIVREIRSYHIKCVFITVSSYGKNAYQSEAKSLNTLAHLTKPLYREKILPVLERAISIVSHSRMRAEQTQQIQAKFDAVVPILEQGLISQLFFPENAAKNIARYKELLDIPQNYFKLVTLTFGEAPQTREETEQIREVSAPWEISKKTDALQNIIGSAVHLQKEYMKFREIVHEFFPLAVISQVMGNHVLFLLPYWKAEETKQEQKDFSVSLPQMLEALEGGIPRLTFQARASRNFRCDAIPFSTIL